MAETQAKRSTSGLAAMLVTVWAIVLLLAFFSNRGDDLGRIVGLLGGLGGGPLFGIAVFDSLIGILAALLILVGWFGLGSLLVRFVPIAKAESHSHILEIAIRIAIGAAGWSLIWFFLGILGLYNDTVAVAAVLAGGGLAAFGVLRVRKIRQESRIPAQATIFERVLLVLIAIPVVLSLIASLAPPTAKDTLLYHFAVPKAFIAQGSSVFIEGNIASYLALGTEMHIVWAMLLAGMFSERAGEAAGGAVIWAFFPLLLAAVFGFAREIGVERRWALISVLMVASVPTAYYVAASAYIDLALSLFVLLAVYSLSRWWRSLNAGWLVYVAIFLGAALSAKLTTLFVIAAFALIVLLRVRKAQESEPDRLGEIAGLGFASLILAGVIASPWNLRTWVETGSPIFPFYMNIWPGEAAGWDVERSVLFQAMNSQYGGFDKTLFDHIALPWNISVTAQPELAAYFDGVLGVAFLLGLPLLIWALWKLELPVEVKIGAGVALIVFVFWLSSGQQLRYLLPILPLLAIAIAASVRTISVGRPEFSRMADSSLVLSCVAATLVGTAWFMRTSPHRVVLGGENRGDYLTRNIDYYPYYQWLNTESTASSNVWLINMRRDSYHLDRPYLSDYIFEDWTLRQMVWESRTLEELKARTAAMGVQYVLTRHDFLFDYAKSPLVDDTKPRAENEAKLEIAKDLILDPKRMVRSDGKFSLVKVF
jgi:hypothetical protein